VAKSPFAGTATLPLQRGPKHSVIADVTSSHVGDERQQPRRQGRLAMVVLALEHARAITRDQLHPVARGDVSGQWMREAPRDRDAGQVAFPPVK